MSSAGGVTAEELVRSLKRRLAALPAEIGTFVVFEACELMLSRGPLFATLSNLSISGEGTVSLASAEATDQQSAARSLHSMLTSLLVAAGPAPTPALLRLVEEGPRDGLWTLEQMRDDLEAALVPLNRTASRRVLARLVRETGRGDKPSGRPQPKPKFNQLDEELSSLLGVEHEPTRESPEEDEKPKEPSNGRSRSQPDEGRHENGPPSDQARGRLADARTPSLKDVADSVTFIDAHPPVMAGSPSAPQLRGLDSLSEHGSLQSLSPPRGKGALVGATLVVLAVALLGLILALRPDAMQRLQGETPASERPKPKAEPPPAPVGGDLVVHVSNERAQILRFVGRGPVTVPHLPLGVAHEFVAIADGALPTRVIVPADAEWERTPEGPRYELAMQGGVAEKEGVPLDFGDTLLPQDVGTPRLELGSVRIVTTPRGAKVYQLIGFAPEARIQDLMLDHTEELLVWKQGHEPVTRVVSPSDFVPQGGRKVAEISISLLPAAKSKHRQ